MKFYTFLLLLLSLMSLSESLFRNTLKNKDDKDFYTKDPPEIDGFQYSSDHHSFHHTCMAISNRLFKDSKDFFFNDTSTFERRGVGITDQLLNEERAQGMMNLWHGWLNDQGSLFYNQELAWPSGILVMDPSGKKNFLKNWVHIRLEIATEILQHYRPEYMFAHMLRRSVHYNWENAAPVGQFVHDFPGYSQCEDVRKEIDSGVAQKPTPYQFLPCQGANAGDNEFANTFFYDFRAPRSHGGSGAGNSDNANGKTDFKKVFHLFWKLNENSCSRKYHEFKFQVILVASYKEFKNKMIPYFFNEFVASIGNVHDTPGQGDLPAGAADPIPPAGGKWNWINCSVPFLYFDKRNLTRHENSRLTWFYELYPKPDQEPWTRNVGTCRPSQLKDDAYQAQFDGTFYGRCDSKRYSKEEFRRRGAEMISTPSPNIFHYCKQERNLDLFLKSSNERRQYEEMFSGAFSEAKSKILVTPSELCHKCPLFPPTSEEIQEIFSKTIKVEELEQQELNEKLEAEMKRKHAQDHAEFNRLEAIRKDAEEYNKSVANRKPAPKPKRIYTVRFDDEDDGWWGPSQLTQRRLTSEVESNLPRSPVAAVGLSVWRFRQLHGIIGAIVTFFLTPNCVFISRYFKETWLRTRILFQPTWLMGHLGLALFSALLHILGVHAAVKGTSMMGSIREGPSGGPSLHKILGFCTLALFILLNLLGAFRPLNTTARSLTIVLHWLLGVAAYALNFACVLTSITLPGSPSAIEDVSLHTNFQEGKVEIIFVLSISWMVIDFIFHIVAHVLLCIADSKEEVVRSYIPVIMSVADEDEQIDLEGSWKRQVLYLVYAIASALMTIAVIGVMYSQLQYGRAFLNTTLTHNADGDLYDDLLEDNRRERIFPPFF